MALCCPVIELRQYSLHTGAREQLVRVFEDHFVEAQEQYGMCIVGQFRDLDAPDRFVWICGFTDMETRSRAARLLLRSSVDGARPGGQRHHGRPHQRAPAAPRRRQGRLRVRPAPSPPSPEAAETDGGLVAATIHHLAVPASPEVLASIRVDPGAGTLLGRFVTERAQNTYPHLPVRENANVLVTFVSYATPDDFRSSASPSETITRVVERRNDMELVTFARFHARPGSEGAVAEAILAKLAPTREEPGCLEIHAFRSIRDRLLFCIHSRWKDEAAFEEHARLPRMIRFVERLESLIDHPFEAARTEQIE
jgi:quinol monooxygenase YgiN